MNSAPAISVVLPTHNGGRYLDQAVESIVAQTFGDWELILVDDGSTDQTPVQVDAWSGRDERIRAIHLAQNRGLPWALNEGFRQASGRRFTWTSDDNWYAAEALELMQRFLDRRPQVDVVYAGWTEVDAEGSAVLAQPARPPQDLAVINCVGACFLYRREVHQALGGYSEDLSLAEDYDFWLRASLAFRLEPLDRLLYFYRRHEAALSQRRRREVFLANQEAVSRWLRRGNNLSRAVRGRALEALGLRALVEGELKAARGHLLRAAWLLRRPPRFHRCRSYAVDFLLGKTAGRLVRRCRGD